MVVFLVGILEFGVLLYAMPMVLGGLLQGRALNDPGVAFMDTLRPGLMALRIGTLGDLLLVVGHAALSLNFLAAGVRGYRRWRERVGGSAAAMALEVRR